MVTWPRRRCRHRRRRRRRIVTGRRENNGHTHIHTGGHTDTSYTYAERGGGGKPV